MNILRDNNQTYSIIHLEDAEDISCDVQMNDAFEDELLCRFHGKALTQTKALENRYFKMHFSAHTVKITPKFHFGYYPFSKSFVQDTEVDIEKSMPANHWIVVGFKGDSNIYTKRDKEGLDFPIIFSEADLPMIGELDYDLKPIDTQIDANALVKIKEAYEAKKYDKVLKEVAYVLENKKSVFSSEAKLYKIRTLDKILNDAESRAEDDGLNPEDIIALAKEWIADNPSTDTLAEMYMYIAKTYIKIGRSSKAEKYLAILQTEYPKSQYNFIAQLANAERIYKSKSKDEAIGLYKKVLYDTDDFDIASLAAFKLSSAYIEKKKPKQAKAFVEKVLHANTAFVQAHADEAYALAKTFAENNESNLSLMIGSVIQEDLTHSNINTDELKKNMAYWQEKNGDIYKAIEGYKRYLDEETYGKYRAFVHEHLDKVMLNADENNETKKLAYLETIMKKYQDDSIYTKALLQKARILLKNAQYKEILQMKDALQKHGGVALLKEVASKELASAYAAKQCKEATDLQNEYNLTMPTGQEEAVFHCYLDLGLYDEALDITAQKMKSDDLKEQLAWSYKRAKIYKQQGKHKALILLSGDVEKLQDLLNTTEYNDIKYDKIIAYYHLGGYDDMMLREVKAVEKLFPDAVKNLDVFEKVLSYAKKRREHSLIVNYAKKMISLQEKHHLETYTPKLQLDYIKALREKERYKEALDEDIKLLYKKLNDTQRAQVLYIAGDLSEKFKKKKEAKEFYTKCGEIVENSAWVELCSENMKLLEE